jgi:hypothetical protein
MKKLSVVFLCITALAALAVWASEAEAFSTYANCVQCHGGFRTVPYSSLADGQSWGSGLHDTHRNTMLNGDCNACHFGSSRTPVYLNKSNGGTGLPAVGCVGCHGRAQDSNGSGPVGPGTGLRQHHFRAGETICLDCHDDADPANYTPVAENVPPPYYFTPDTAHPNKPTDSCNQSGKENFAGSARGLDNDGNGLYDGNDPACQAACIDNDGDGYGSNGDPSCPKGTAIDCNDNDPAVNPGASEGPYGTPACSDGKDNDCNGLTDAADPQCANTGCVDKDGDGYGANGDPSCPNGTTIDCNDNNPKEHPNQTWYQDADGDGYSNGNMIIQCANPAGYKIASELKVTSGDCNDSSAAVNPEAVEVCDGVDNNCNAQVDEGISSTPTTCGTGACASTGILQCTNGQMVDTCTAKAAQTEGPVGDPTCSDGQDNDCNGLTDAADPKCGGSVVACIDKDGDGYGANGSPLCSNSTAIDCNDKNSREHPDQTWYKDADGDGYSNGKMIVQCKRPRGYKSASELKATSGDCKDSKSKIHPGAREICDGIDNNCDGQIDEGVKKTFYRDADKDGYGNPSVSVQSCKKPSGYVKNNTDCNDSSSKIKPHAAEICGDNIDQNCNGLIDCSDPGCSTKPSCSNPDEENDDESGDSNGNDAPFLHNVGMDCTSCHAPHNAIPDCMACHTRLTED